MKLAMLSVLVAGAAATAPIVQAPENGLKDRWIVTFENQNFEAWKQIQLLDKALDNMHIERTYNINNGAFLGVAGEFSADAVHLVAELPGVKSIEQDALAFTQQTSRPISQTGHWGLDRADGTFDNAYRHQSAAGEGAVVYVLDTGIRTTHTDYENRAEFGENYSTSPDGDRHGHGTHCACTVAGATHGIASSATVVDVKVLGDSGSGAWSGIISGMEWADNDCAAREQSVCVQSLSLGGGFNQAINDAVDAVARSRSAMVIASGNSNADACRFSPASADGAYTINSAQRSGDSLTRSSFSNYGTCTQAYSAGSTVLSCGVSSDTATATMSGTSMATPHAAGSAAVCIANGASSVQAVYDCLNSNLAQNAVANNPSGPNDYVEFRQ